MFIKNLQSNKLSKQIYDDLKYRIMTLDIKPGEAVTEVQLTEYYKASRTPVREAMKALLVDSHLVKEPGQGIIAPRMSIDSYNEIYQLRDVLESLSVRLATLNYTQEDMEKLKANMEEQRILMAGPYAPLEFLNLDREFHLLLADISHNSHLRTQMEKMYDLFFRYNYFCDFENRFIFAITEHERILNFIEARNTYAVQEEMKNHMNNINGLIIVRLAKRLSQIEEYQDKKN